MWSWSAAADRDHDREPRPQHRFQGSETFVGAQVEPGRHQDRDGEPEPRDVPDAVAVSEALALVGDLSTDDSPTFVNGVLGALSGATSGSGGQ